MCSTELTLPKFAFISNPNSNMSLAVRKTGKKTYYRDGGQWSTNVKIVDDKIICTAHFVRGHLLTGCTEEEWRKCNGQYAPSLKSFKDEDDELAF